MPDNGHCLFSSLRVCLGLKVTPTAVQQLRELLACHVEQNFNTHLHASMPEVTKFQLLDHEQLRCFDEVAHPNYWGDANCLLVFTSCYGHGVVVLSADGDTCHWAFAAESPKMLIVSFSSAKSHYEAVTQAPSTSHRHLEVSTYPTANPSLLHPPAVPLPPLAPNRCIPRAPTANVPQSRPIILIEAFAGLGVLSITASQFGLEPSAFLERDKLLLRVLQERHPEAHFAAEFADGKWKLWKFPDDAFIIIVGGPPCTTVSAAGKQLGAADPRSTCINVFLEIAVFFGAQMALMENVPQLIKDDDRHGLFSSAAELAEEGRIPLLGTFELTDTLCKGKSQRCRSWFSLKCHLSPCCCLRGHLQFKRRIRYR